MSDQPNLLDCFAVTALGLEPVAARELESFGMPRAALRPELGGVAFRTDRRGLYEANLRLRTASRVLVRVASFTATAFWEIERRARPLPWERWLAPGGAVAVRATCRKSRLYHSDAVAERVLEAAARRVAGVVAAEAGDDDADEGGGGAQLVVARLARDELTLSVDASGELLHRRGYRQAVAKAPLRETIAAAMLLASGWDRTSPLLDPFCGSGTIPIEGALLARDVAPGLARARTDRFAFARWPEHDARLWRSLVDEAESRVRPSAPGPIVGRDRDAGAIAAAVANAERAGVAGDVRFERRPLEAPDDEPAASGPGWMVANPPYGLRVGDADGVAPLWERLGDTIRARYPGWRVALLSPDPSLDRRTGVTLRERFATRNGGVPVRLVVGGSEA